MLYKQICLIKYAYMLQPKQMALLFTGSSNKNKNKHVKRAERKVQQNKSVTSKWLRQSDSWNTSNPVWKMALSALSELPKPWHRRCGRQTE